MSRILIITSGEAGHLNPITALLQRLVAAGHEVDAVVRGPKLSDARRAALAGVTVIPNNERPHSSPKSRVELFRDAEGRRARLFERLPSAIAAVAELSKIVDERAPDVVAVDSYVLSGVIAAHLSGKPWATLRCDPTSNVPLPVVRSLMEDVDMAIAFRDQLFGHFSIPTQSESIGHFSPWLNIVFAAAEYLGTDSYVPPRTHFVGASLAERRGDEVEFDWGPPDSRPVVYVSFGSVFSWQPELLRAIVAAGSRLDVRLFVSSGSLGQADLLDAPSTNVSVLGYVPQLEMLSRAAAFVTHGGFNSVTEALYEGVPMVVVPLAIDQAIQAHYVERAGAGITVSPKGLTADSVEAALRTVLAHESSQRACAKALARTYRALDGAAAGAKLLADLALTPA